MIHDSIHHPTRSYLHPTSMSKFGCEPHIDSINYNQIHDFRPQNCRYVVQFEPWLL